MASALSAWNEGQRSRLNEGKEMFLCLQQERAGEGDAGDKVEAQGTQVKEAIKVDRGA